MCVFSGKWKPTRKICAFSRQQQQPHRLRQHTQWHQQRKILVSVTYRCYECHWSHENSLCRIYQFIYCTCYVRWRIFSLSTQLKRNHTRAKQGKRVSRSTTIHHPYQLWRVCMLPRLRCSWEVVQAAACARPCVSFLAHPIAAQRSTHSSYAHRIVTFIVLQWIYIAINE